MHRSLWQRLRWAAVALVLVVGLTAGSVAAAVGADPDLRNLLETVINLVSMYYKEPVDRQKLLEGAIRGALGSLGDPYTAYMDAQEYRNFLDSLSEQQFEGIGVFLGEKGPYHVILAPMPGSPAAEAGLLPGDLILEAGGVNLVGEAQEKAVSLIRGPAGTRVRLKIQRPRENRVFEVEIVRAAVTVPIVEHRMLEEGVGYIKVWYFSMDAAQRFLNAYRALERQGMKALVLDLRDNGGGYLDPAVTMVGFWTGEGAVATQMLSRGEVTETRTHHPRVVTVPSVVLVNENSASAAEVLAGALQDHGAARLVGTRTFGKGSVQNLIPLQGGGALKVTTAEYRTPKGRKVDGVGLTPDVEARRPEPPAERTAAMAEDQALLPGQVSLEVLALQQRLNDLGYRAGPENGVFGSQTQWAVERFQKDQGLPVTGRVDSATLERLNAAVRDRVFQVLYAEDPQLMKAVEVLKAARAPEPAQP